MADHLVPPQQVDPISANTYPHPTGFYQFHGQNRHVAGDDQQLEGVHREGVPQPMGNMVMQGEMRDPRHIDAPNYNPAYYHPPPPQYPEVPHVYIYRDVRAAGAAPAQAHPFVPEPEVQENRNDFYGHGAHLPPAGPPEAFLGVPPHPAAPTQTPPVNGLRNLAGRFLNNPDTRVIMLRIEPGARGRFEVWIALELAEIF